MERPGPGGAVNAWGLAALLLGGLDWSQTQTIARHPAVWHERNPVLGLHPSVGAVNTYFAGAAVATAGVALVLEPGPRRWWLRAVTALELANVVRNRAIGITLTF